VFRRILIANRGEIARRIIRTARALGVETVAVYSDADRGALFTQEADRALALGGNSAAESYLSIPKVIAACKESKAEAVHPGYGFLSENAGFVDALNEAGIAFIGPPASAIRALGDKIAAKTLAQKSGVSVVPGFVGALASPDEAVKVAREVGYPVILKAAAGGGGKGMRIARSDDEVREGLKLAMSEAQSSFADSRVFIERYIENPRHIEVQVLGDQHGKVLALFERECSLQRRHQKVIEEAPSPFISAKTRAQMCEQAVMLAKAAGYYSAGTIEFIVAPDQRFYFLEMNTRLQVEHPVTELVTGLDLVEQMLRVAAGEKLPFDKIELKGHAIEARVYAEDPSRGFLPSIGRLTRYRPPAPREGLRLDDGIREGDEISMFYDPMIAKLIGFGATREQASARLAAALDEFEIEGLRHNLTFLAALVRHPRFTSFDFSTGFIGSEWPDGFKGVVLSEERLTRLLAALTCYHRLRQTSAMDYVAVIEGKRYELHCREGKISVGGRELAVQIEAQAGQPLVQAIVEGERLAILIKPQPLGYKVRHAGAELNIQLLSPRAAELMAKMPLKAPPDLSRYLLSPMPGLLLRLEVKVGEPVKAGQVLAVVEAMKMENVLRATADAVVASLQAKAGDSLAVDQVILEFAKDS
jgi:propionyl-CoA carboxylase alpha chain